MARKRDKGKNDKVEFLAAVFVVIFIFSLIGVLNLADIVKQVAPAKTESIPDIRIQEVGKTNGLSDKEPEATVGSSQERVPIYGTPLSPATSHFSVEDSAQISKGITGLTISDLK
jgi:hypothetical protein